MNIDIDNEIRDLTATIERAAKKRSALLGLKGEISRLKFLIDSPKTKLFLLEHVDTGDRMDGCIHTGLVRATKLLVPSALVEPAESRSRVAEYSFDHLHVYSHPFGARGARIESAKRCGAMLGEQLFGELL